MFANAKLMKILEVGTQWAENVGVGVGWGDAPTIKRKYFWGRMERVLECHGISHGHRALRSLIL